MSTLILSPRYTDDSRIVRAAAIKAGWSVLRLGGWRAPEEFAGEAAVRYGEVLSAELTAFDARWAAEAVRVD